MTSRHRALTKEIGTGTSQNEQTLPAGIWVRVHRSIKPVRAPGNYEHALSAGRQAHAHQMVQALGKYEGALSASGWARVLRARGLATISHRLAGARCPTHPWLAELHGPGILYFLGGEHKVHKPI